MSFDENFKGVYDSLTSMEKRSFKKSVEKNAQKEQERLEEALARKVIRLKKQRDLCKLKLARGDEREDNLNFSLLKKLKEIQWIYRLLGISVVALDEDTFQLTFTTSYRGIFYESYKAELKHSENKFSLVKHDFPKFISTEDLSLWLQGGTERFFSLIHSHLQAFIWKREELKAVKVQLKDRLSDEITAFDLSFIQFVVNLSSDDSSNSSQIEVSLSYADPFALLPYAVQVIPTDSSTVVDKKLLKDWTRVFKSCCLMEAVSQVFG